MDLWLLWPEYYRRFRSRCRQSVARPPGRRRRGGRVMAHPFQKLARFRSEWCVDFEFHQDTDCLNRVSYTDKYGDEHTDTGNIVEPVALTAYERRTGTTIRLGYDELRRRKAPPYPTGPADLFISYYGTAEL